MRDRTRLLALLLAFLPLTDAAAQSTGLDGETILPTQPVAKGLAPHLEAKLVRHAEDEDVYAIIFHKDDEVLSGLTDFAAAHGIGDAHFTAIGAASGAVLGYLDLSEKLYHPIRVNEQVEVLSLMGDVATFDGKPSVHMHTILGRRDGSTVGGHIWRLVANPTLEVFMTVNRAPLVKKPDPASGMRLIDPTR
jgi:predicted DNA-binding protein with PD1-like motif